MIPLRISLEGFLSYREKQIFSFADAPLWALSGPNGAGKSAVFDGITFALYGRHTRHQSREQKIKDLIHLHADHLVVEFDFELNGQGYRICRTVSRRGRSTFGVHRLIAADEGGGSLIDPIEGTESEDGLRNWVKREIGLDYEAFTASLLLMQGRSEKLLESDPRRRYEVLADLIDLSRYQRLHQLADEQRRQYEAAAKDKGQQLQKIRKVSDEEVLIQQQTVAQAEEEWRAAQTHADELQSMAVQAKQWEQLTADLTQQQVKDREAGKLLERAEEIESCHRRLSQLDVVLPLLKQIITNRARLEECEQLSKQERDSGRKQMPKHLHAEVRWVAPWEHIQSAVDKAYGKFRSDTPNLLIIADDLFVGLEHGTGLNVGLALYEPGHGGRFTNSLMENLGGVGIFCVKRKGVEVWYSMKLFLNPHALPAVAIPEQLALAFNAVDNVDRW